MPQGLRFACQRGCTVCCRQPGFVYLTEQDLERAAEFLHVTKREFERRYVYRTRNRLRLRVPRQSQCSFLTDEGCSIHEAKPTQCRVFPFWPELVESRREWRKAAGYCPGMDAGPLIKIETARNRAGEMRLAYPAMY